MDRVELLWKEKENYYKTQDSENIYIINEFLNILNDSDKIETISEENAKM